MAAAAMDGAADRWDPTDIGCAANVLFDVVVLAGGEAARMSPLCDATPKPMLPLCNRPLIWYSLQPWIAAGARVVTVLVKDEDQSLSVLQHCLASFKEFEGVKFYFVAVPNFVERGAGGGTVLEASDTADALRCYARFKAELEAKEGAGDPAVPRGHGCPRDVLVLSCDTILANVDVRPFIANFYRSASSASVLLVRPQPAPPAAKNSGSGARRAIPEDLCCVGLAPEPTTTEESASADIEHFRLHLHYGEDVQGEPVTLDVGYLVRRPELTFSRDVVDAHVYLLRQWVVDYVAGAPDVHSLREDLIGTLASGQLWKCNGTDPAAAGAHRRPAHKLGFRIPGHWAVRAGDHRSVRWLNAMQDSLPRAWDEARVHATVYAARADSRIIRVNTSEKYMAASMEMLLGCAASPLAAFAAGHLRRETEEAMAAVVLPAGTKPTIRSSALQAPCRVDDPSSVKVSSCILGKGTRLHPRCTLLRCVVMDNVEIGAGAVLEDCVVCASVRIGEGEARRPDDPTLWPLVVTMGDGEDDVGNAAAGADSDDDEAAAEDDRQRTAEFTEGNDGDGDDDGWFE